MELIEKLHNLARARGETHEYKVREVQRDFCPYGRGCNKVFGACQHACRTCGTHNNISFWVVEDGIITRYCDLDCATLRTDLLIWLREHPEEVDPCREVVAKAWESEDPETVKGEIARIVK